MITEFRIGGFKAFREEQKIPIRPLTLIFGPNGSGKSSILHGMALAHEVLLGNDWDVYQTRLMGPQLNLGGERQFTFQSPGARGEFTTLGVKISSDPVPGSVPTGTDAGEPYLRVELYGNESEETFHLEGPLRGSIWRGEELILSWRDGEDSWRAGWPGLCVDLVGGGSVEAAQVLKDIHGQIAPPTTFVSWLEGFCRLLRAPASPILPDHLFVAPADDVLAHLRAQQSLEKVPAIPDGLLAMWVAALSRTASALTSQLQGVSHTVAQELKRWEYLGPIRPLPPRLVTEDTCSDRTMKGWFELTRGSGLLLEQVNKWLTDEERLRTHYNLEAIDFIQREKLFEVADQLVELDEPGSTFRSNLEYLFEAGAVEVPREWRLAIVNTRTKARTSLSDVGVGISQMLPIVVAAVVRKNHLVAIEQPELHLHPAVQASLGDLFIESALGERRNTFVLETHSEHLILRILRRIRQTSEGKTPDWLPAIRPEDIAVLYVTREEDGARVVELRVNQDGEFDDPWPQGFFPERAWELF